jgi:hypothetical protein
VAFAVLPQPEPRLAALVAWVILGGVAVAALAERRAGVRRDPAVATGPVGA